MSQFVILSIIITMSKFIDEQKSTSKVVIPVPTDDQLWKIEQSIRYAVKNDPYVNYESMIMRGYRVITPFERYYYEKSIENCNYDSPYSKLGSLWILVDQDFNQKHLDFQQHRQKLKHDNKDDNHKYQDSNNDDDCGEIYSLKRKAIEESDSTTSNNYDIPTAVDTDADVDSTANTIGALLHEW